MIIIMCAFNYNLQILLVSNISSYKNFPVVSLLFFWSRDLLVHSIIHPTDPSSSYYGSLSLSESSSLVAFITKKKRVTAVVIPR